MATHQKIALFVVRLSLGWLFFYAGITKVIDPNWSAAGYLSHAQDMSGFFASLASPELLPAVNFVNAWGLTLLGASLILGLLIRISGPLGALLMLLYYLALPFPKPDANSFVVDEHIIYSAALLLLAALNAGKVWGLDGRIRLARRSTEQ